MANQAAEEISGGDHIIGCHATFVCVVGAMQGHWTNECPAVGCSFPSDSGYSVGSNNESQGHPPDTNVYGANHIQLMSDDNRSEVYIDAKVRGRTLPALLDSGCEKSICALRLCKNARITPVRTEFYAANSTPISVAGTTCSFFEIGGIPTYADVYVSDEVDEFIIGFDQGGIKHLVGPRHFTRPGPQSLC